MLLSPLTSAKTYRYINEKGEVVYTQFLPPKDAESTIIKAPPPPPSTAEESDKQLSDTMQKNKTSEANNQEASNNEAIKEKNAKTKSSNCKAAKNNLAVLKAPKRNKIVDSKGNKIKYSDSQRQQQIEAAQKIIKENCQ